MAMRVSECAGKAYMVEKTSFAGEEFKSGRCCVFTGFGDVDRERCQFEIVVNHNVIVITRDVIYGGVTGSCFPLTG